MADVSGNTLVMAIQAVDDAICALDARLRAGAGDPRDDAELRMHFARAAEELRSAYAVARLGAGNLPPYEHLVRAEQD